MSPGTTLGARAAALRLEFDAAFARAQETEVPDSEELLLIEVAGEPFGLRASEIAGLHRDQPVTRLPGGPPAQAGVTGFRRAVVPVYDLRALLGHPPAETRWMALTGTSPSVALAFDRFEAQRRVVRDDLVASEHAQPGDLTAGVVVIDGIARPIIDIPAAVATVAAHASDWRNR